MTEGDIEKVLADHEGRLEALEQAAGLASAAPAEGVELCEREQRHRALARRIHGEAS